MTPTILLSSAQVNNIFHISDVHIRVHQRHKEYEQVFTNLYNYLKTVVDANSIIVLTGDILHSKTELSPECIRLTCSLFRSLASIAPTIIIAGNHDCNLSNRHRMDALTPLVEDIMASEKFYYLKETGYYRYGSVMFTVTSVHDNIFLPLTDDKLTHIYLYHGPVHGAVTDVGARMNENEWTIEKFAGYDYVLLGDIHKAQFLSDNIAYSGSLIQQNYGEKKNGHGLIKWDLCGNTHEFVEIDNDYGYYTLDMNYTGKPLCKYPRIRFISDTPEECVHIIEELRHKYDVQEIINETKEMKIDREELSVNGPNGLEEYLTAQGTPVELIPNIIKLHNSLSKNGPSINRGLLKINKLVFSNMLSYGTDNEIDFSKQNGIIGIMAPNHYGKSAIIDIILFLLFDKFTRGDRRDILNKSKVSFKGELYFSLDEQSFLIQRSGEKSKNSISFSNAFFKITDAHERIGGSERGEVNAEISKYVGSYDNYVSTFFLLQDGSHNLIDMTQLERKNYLYQVLGIDHFNELYDQVKDKDKELKGVIKGYQKMIQDAELDKKEELLFNYYVSYMDHSKTYDSLSLPTVADGESPAVIRKEIAEVEQKKDAILARINSLSENIEVIDIDYPTLLEEQHNIMTELNCTKTKMNREYIYDREEFTLNTDVRPSALIKEELAQNPYRRGQYTFEFSGSCSACGHNKKMLNFTDNNELMEELEKSLRNESYHEFVRRDKEIDAHNLQVMNDTIETCYEMEQVKRLEKRLKAIRVELALYERVIAQQQILAHIDADKQIIKDLEERIIKLKEKEEKAVILQEERIERDMVHKKMVFSKSQTEFFLAKINQVKHQIEQVQNVVDELAKEEKTADIYKHYLKMIHANGLPYQMLKKYLPLIETRANNILANIAPFTLSFIIKGANTIDIVINTNDNSYGLSLASGFEKFISGLMLRLSLSKIFAGIRPDMMIIDEGWSCMDGTNLSNIHSILTYLKTEFSHVLIISHLEQLKSEADSIISIMQKDGLSYLIFHC